MKEGPFKFCNQVLISSYRKPRWLNASASASSGRTRLSKLVPI
jgi:hypothetical protein